MPEFTKVWSVANIALNKLTARLFTVGVLVLFKKSSEIFVLTKSRYSKIKKFLVFIE